MKNKARMKFLVVLTFALALTASLLVATHVGAQERAKTKQPPSSFMPVIEEPFDAVMKRDKAAKASVMAAALRRLEERYDLTRRVDPVVKMTRGKAIPLDPRRD